MQRAWEEARLDYRSGPRRIFVTACILLRLLQLAGDLQIRFTEIRIEIFNSYVEKCKKR